MKNASQNLSSNLNVNPEFAPYRTFAKVYDTAMAHVPYLRWASFIDSTLLNHRIERNELLLEMGCGTGILAKHLHTLYPSLITSYISFEMLQAAGNKNLPFNLQANMCALPFIDQAFSAALATHDVLNYLPDSTSLQNHFHETARVMRKGGIYIFDVTSEMNVVEFYDGQTITEEYETMTLTWENFYDKRKKEIISTLSFMPKDETKTVSNRNQIEIHRQNVFSPAILRKSIKSAGFKILGQFADYSRKKSLKNARLIVYVLQRL